MDYKLPELPRRMRDISTAKGHDEFYKAFRLFTGINNFKHEEIFMIMSALNSFYMMGADIDK